jgi:hypothetical protein
VSQPLECTGDEAQCNCLGCRIARVVDQDTDEIHAADLIDGLATIIGRVIEGAPDRLQAQLVAQAFERIAEEACFQVNNHNPAASQARLH